MVAISKILHFISHHGVYTAIILVFLLCFIAVRTKKAKWMILILPLALANGFGSQFLNAWFLNRFGTESTAIITADNRHRINPNRIMGTLLIIPEIKIKLPDKVGS